MILAGGTERGGNTGETANSSFHPSHPPGVGYLLHRKALIRGLELARGIGRTLFHPGNPGLDACVQAKVVPTTIGSACVSRPPNTTAGFDGGTPVGM